MGSSEQTPSEQNNYSGKQDAGLRNVHVVNSIEGGVRFPPGLAAHMSQKAHFDPGIGPQKAEIRNVYAGT